MQIVLSAHGWMWLAQMRGKSNCHEIPKGISFDSVRNVIACVCVCVCMCGCGKFKKYGPEAHIQKMTLEGHSVW